MQPRAAAGQFIRGRDHRVWRPLPGSAETGRRRAPATQWNAKAFTDGVRTARVRCDPVRGATLGRRGAIAPFFVNLRWRRPRPVSTASHSGS